ncbi:hypothetical protein FKP32DRAFT_1283966 [Trametes sanguinea]|nr:hypothetical protein FKP32DRAFT_1283966 [Trametes sanguinea]
MHLGWDGYQSPRRVSSGHRPDAAVIDFLSTFNAGYAWRSPWGVGHAADMKLEARRRPRTFQSQGQGRAAGDVRSGVASVAGQAASVDPGHSRSLTADCAVSIEERRRQPTGRTFASRGGKGRGANELVGLANACNGYAHGYSGGFVIQCGGSAAVGRGSHRADSLSVRTEEAFVALAGPFGVGVQKLSPSRDLPTPY